MARNDREREEIEADIQRTRARIEGRLDNLSNQFSPATLMDRALGTTGVEGDQDTFNVMVERARTNPLSALLIGVGLAGMVLNRPTERPAPLADDETRALEPYSDDPAERIGQNINALEAQANDLRASASETASNLADSVTGAVSSVVDSVTGAASSARQSLSGSRHRVRETYDDTIDRAGRRAEGVRDAARQAPVRARVGAESAVDWVKENPVPAGLFALAAGASIASLLAARDTRSVETRADAAERLHEQAEREATARANRREDVAVAVARDDAAKRKRAAKAKPASRKPRATTATKRKPKAKVAVPASGKLGKNLDRSTAVQGSSTKS